MKTRREDPRLCRCCQDKKAIYILRGRVKSNGDHDLCFRCFRALLDRCRCTDLEAA